MSRQNKQQKVIKSIEEAILTRVHNPGDRLPPEKDLMERYEVGRGTLREALKALEQQGLIELRRGANGGAYVKEMDPEYASRTLSMLIRHQQVPAEYIIEFREVLEEKTAVFAAERASEEDIKRLNETLKAGRAYAEAGESNFEEFYRWELSMHLEMAKIARNPLFRWTTGTLHLDFKPFWQLIRMNREAYYSSLNDWEEIVEAMAKREVSKVAFLARLHVGRLRKRLKYGAKAVDEFEANYMDSPFGEQEN